MCGHEYVIFRLHSSFYFSICLCRKQVAATKVEAEVDGVTVPTTLSDYCISAKPKPSESASDMGDFYDDDYFEDDDDNDDDGIMYDDDEDSGNGES